MALIECPECGGKVSDKAGACIHCGYPLQESIQYQYCFHCGKKVMKEDLFCGYCGKSLSVKREEQETVSNNTKLEDSGTDILRFKGELDVVDPPRQAVLPREPEYKARCPRCGSTSLSGGKQGFGFGKAAAGAFLVGGIGVLAGGIGANKTLIICMNCGHKYNLKG